MNPKIKRIAIESESPVKNFSQSELGRLIELKNKVSNPEDKKTIQKRITELLFKKIDTQD